MLAKSPSVETMLSNPTHNDLQGRCVIPSHTDIEKEIFSYETEYELVKNSLIQMDMPHWHEYLRSW